MKVSLNWLQKYFDQPLPSAEVVADAFTFHSFEIEEQEGDMMDVKVLPNRAADCLCHRGIAKDLAAILDLSFKNDSLRTPIQNMGFVNPYLNVEIEDPKKCLRYVGALVKGVKIGPSPAWLKEAIEAVGQRSINNIVDATNYVMLNIGQPMHAFDAAKLEQKEGKYTIGVRSAKKEEKITTLSGEEFSLPESVLLITDANADVPIGIAGIKGGKHAEITVSTTDIVVESANFDGTTIRRAAQTLKLPTDASLRFQNRPSPELALYGMRDVLALIQEIAGGEIVGMIDEYPTRSEKNSEVSVSLSKISGVLGVNFLKEEVTDVFRRLDLNTKIDDETFIVTPPFERNDIQIPEDLIEEVGRILGYDRVSAAELPPATEKPNQARYRGIERVKDFLIDHGFTEISTQSFAKKGDIVLANPLDKTKPALRTTLGENMKEALERARYFAPLVLAPNEKPRLFEIGTIFTKDGEKLAVETSEPVPELPAIRDDENYQPKQYHLDAYQPFSLYPFITRDIALWVPKGVETKEIENSIRDNASDLLLHLDQFDSFEKEGRVSFAFRLVFQSFDRTLTDDEVNGIMQKVTEALTAKGYEVR